MNGQTENRDWVKPRKFTCSNNKKRRHCAHFGRVMLSYQHHYHAGNHADVLKHWVLLACVRHLQNKPSPFDYIDTHSGAGLYNLAGSMARKTGESQQGVLKLDWQQLPLMADYQQQIADDLAEQHYPGSCLLVKRLLRPDDKAWLYEMHPQTFRELESHCAKRRQCYVKKEDGFQGLLSVLPTTSKRALVLIDPAYEVKQDYKTVVEVLKKAYAKMAGATYLLWYPKVGSEYVRQLEQGIKKSGVKNAQLFEISVRDPSSSGMAASGIIAINPPWTLAEQFRDTAPQLSEQLSEDGQARWRHEVLVAE